MTFRTRFVRPRARALLVLASVATALAVAGPAAAQPTDANGKKHCSLAAGRDTLWVPHGSTITVTFPNGEKKTMTCEDGVWKEARARIFPTITRTALLTLHVVDLNRQATMLVAL
jgi:hypothetical protein